jgi:hypothetical protein
MTVLVVHCLQAKMKRTGEKLGNECPYYSLFDSNLHGLLFKDIGYVKLLQDAIWAPTRL